MHYIKYYGDITPFGMSNLQMLLIKARHDGHDEVTILLASKGGDVDAGMSTYNFIRHKPVPKINIHVDGNLSSIAVTMLLAGDHRSASPASLFSIHQATYAEGPNRGGRSNSTDLIAQPFKDILKWSDEDVNERFSSEDFKFSPHQAKDLGCIHSITDFIFKPEDTIDSTRAAP